MRKIMEIRPVIIKLLQNNNQYFGIQSRLHMQQTSNQEAL